MHIGILQTGHAPDGLLADHGNYSDMFERLLDGNGFVFRTYYVVDMDFPDAVTDCDGWLITGSKHGTYEDHPFIAPLEDFIHRADAANTPMVGICFGHQIIAQALGGRVTKFPNGWAVGRQSYDWDGETIALNAWHQDQVVARPNTATVHASNAFCENAALVYDNRIFTVQAHPEFDNEFTGKLADIRGEGVVPDARLQAVRDSLNKPVDNDRLARKIAHFFKERQLA